MEINGFDSNDVHALRQRNIESSEPEMEKIGDKFDFILHNNLINERWNQNTDMIKKFDPPKLVQLYNVTLMHYKLLHFLEEIISLYLFKRVADYLGD